MAKDRSLRQALGRDELSFHQTEYLLKEAFGTLGRHKGITTLSVVIMSLTLLVLAVFLLVTDNMLNLVAQARQEIKVYAYLKEGVSQKQIEDHHRRLLALDAVESVIFVSKSEALDEFRQQMGEEREYT